VLAAVAVGVYFLITLVFPLIRRHLPSAATGAATLRVQYPDGRGILRRVLNEATRRGFVIEDLATELSSWPSGRQADGDGLDRDGVRQVTVTLQMHGRQPVSELIGALSDLEYVNAVVASRMNDADE
jgi:putative Mg2+ transporter-C (MgtC) family protein